MSHEEFETQLGIVERTLQDGDYAEVQHLCEDVLADANVHEHPDMLARLYVQLSESLWRRSLFEPALQRARQALDVTLRIPGSVEQAKALANIGIVYTNLCEYDKAEDALRTAHSLYEHLNMLPAAALVLGNLGAVYGNVSDYARAFECFQRAYALCTEVDDPKGMALNARNLGLLYFMQSEFTTSLEYTKTADRLYVELNDHSGSAACAVTIGNVHEAMSEFTPAMQCYERALQLYTETNNVFGAASCYGSMGNIYLSLSDYVRALEHMNKALVLFEEMGSRDNQAACTGNIGLVYHSIGDYAHALDYLNRALRMSEELGITSSIATRRGNIGAVYRDLGDLPQALEHCRKAHSLFSELHNKSGVATTLATLASIYAGLGEYSQALDACHEALKSNEEIANRSGIAQVYALMGMLYAETNFASHNDSLAEQYLVQARAINEEIGTKGQNVGVLEALIELYKKHRRWETVLLLEQHHALEKSLHNEDVKKFAQRLEFERLSAEREKLMAVERTRHHERESILNNVLPQQITARLIKGENPIADHYECVSVLFMDIVGFTPLSGMMSAGRLVLLLNAIFTEADAVIRRHGLEKIKTIGDAYMAVAGAPIVQEDHYSRAAFAALDLLELIRNINNSVADEDDPSLRQAISALQVRIGLHCGPAAAGVVGESKFLYDLWGDAVNTASRMESHGQAGKVHVSEDFALHCTQVPSLRCVERGTIEVKGKGSMKTYFLEKA